MCLKANKALSKNMEVKVWTTFISQRILLKKSTQQIRCKNKTDLYKQR